MIKSLAAEMFQLNSSLALIVRSVVAIRRFRWCVKVFVFIRATRVTLILRRSLSGTVLRWLSELNSRWTLIVHSCPMLLLQRLKLLHIVGIPGATSTLLGRRRFARGNSSTRRFAWWTG
jgi:hypothetical protein